MIVSFMDCDTLRFRQKQPEECWVLNPSMEHQLDHLQELPVYKYFLFFKSTQTNLMEQDACRWHAHAMRYWENGPHLVHCVPTAYLKKKKLPHVVRDFDDQGEKTDPGQFLEDFSPVGTLADVKKTCACGWKSISVPGKKDILTSTILFFFFNFPSHYSTA